MRVLLCILVLLPIVWCASIEERFLFPHLNLDGVVKILQNSLGSDVSEAACETGCPLAVNAIPGGSLVSGFLCKPACEQLQSLVQSG